MQMYLADCQFPDIDNQVKAYKLFIEAWESGEMAKSDNTDKFENCLLIIDKNVPKKIVLQIKKTFKNKKLYSLIIDINELISFR